MRRARAAGAAVAAAAAVALGAVGLAACGAVGSTGTRDVGAAPARPTTSTSTTLDRPVRSTTTTTATSVPSTPTTGGTATAPPTTAGTSTSPPTTAAPATTTVTLWLVAGEHVVPVPRQVAAVEGIGAEALRALLAGPTAGESSFGLGTAVPPSTRLLGLDLDGSLATVDLSSEFESGGGSLSVTLRLAQVVCTLDAFPTIDEVAFHLDGEPVSVFSGEGAVLDGPVACSDYGEVLGTDGPPPGGEEGDGDQAAEDGFRVANTVESFMAARQAGSGWEPWVTDEAVANYDADPGDELALVPVAAWSITRIDGAGPFEVTVEVDDRVEVLTVDARGGTGADGSTEELAVVAARPGP
jgi:spore germination protein GerM